MSADNLKKVKILVLGDTGERSVECTYGGYIASNTCSI